MKLLRNIFSGLRWIKVSVCKSRGDPTNWQISTDRKIIIFFGSQTGTAEEFARRLAKNARLYGLKALVVDPEEIDIVIINTFILLIMLNDNFKY